MSPLKKEQPDGLSLNLNKHDLFQINTQIKKKGGFLDLLDDAISNNPVFDNFDQTKESLRVSTVS